MLPENQQIIHPIDKVYEAITSYLTGNTTNTHQVAVLLLMTALYLYGRGIRWVIWALHLNQNHLQTNTWQESVTSKYARNKEWLHSKHFFLSVLFFFFFFICYQLLRCLLSKQFCWEHSWCILHTFFSGKREMWAGLSFQWLGSHKHFRRESLAKKKKKSFSSLKKGSEPGSCIRNSCKCLLSTYSWEDDHLQ